MADTRPTKIVVCGPPKECTCPAVAWHCVCEAGSPRCVCGHVQRLHAPGRDMSGTYCDACDDCVEFEALS